MSEPKKKLTPEELSLIRAENARRAVAKRIANGNNNNGGRPKGAKNKGPSMRVEPKTMSLRKIDYEVYAKLASVKGVSIAEFMHILADNLKAKNPKLFVPVRALPDPVL